VKRALCIATNYAGTPSALQGCVNDAHAWSDTLTRHGIYTELLVEQDATKARILDALRAGLRASGPDDLLVVTWSGHGTRVPDRDADETDRWDEAIVPHDYPTAGMITDDDLYALFAPAITRGVRVVGIFDSCFSGTMQRLAPALLAHWDAPHPAYRKQRWLPPQDWLDEADYAELAAVPAPAERGLSRRTACTLNACRDSEVTFDAYVAGRYCGIFTHVALKALSEFGDDLAGVTYAAWMRRIRTHLPSQDFDNTPQLDATKAQRYWTVFTEQG
jgi:hypothetical protein